MRKCGMAITTSKALAIVVIIVGAAFFGYYYETSGAPGTRTSTQMLPTTEWSNFSARTFSVGCCPGYVAIDHNTGVLYVSVQGADAVYAVNASTGTQIANISVGSYPRDVVVNSITGMVYVVDQGSDSVSVISGATNKVVETLSVGRNPVEIALNQRTGYLYVPDELSNEISVIDGSRNEVVAEVPLSCNGPCTNSSPGLPNSVDIDTATNMVYVANNGFNSLQVLNGSNNQLVATIPVGTYPDGVAVDSESNTVYVANMLSNTVSVVNATAKVVISTLQVGTHPGDVVFDPPLGDVFVSNGGNDTVSVIGTVTNRLIANVTVGAPCCNPDGIAADSSNGDVYVAVPDLGNVSVISKCVSSRCPVISGSTPSCGSYAIIWTYPDRSPVEPGSPIASSITTCTRGLGSWSITAESSNVIVAGDNFSCPCTARVLFNYTAGVPPFANGTYWLQESFKGGGFGLGLAVSAS